MADLPTIRWGIIGTGPNSGRFVEDLVLDRLDAKFDHTIQAIGSSSLQEGLEFVAQFCPHGHPAIYESFKGVYENHDVDIVYIGTATPFHKMNCLHAIANGKAILCEGPLAGNAHDARIVLKAAQERGIYVVEGAWLRHHPMVQNLRRMLHHDEIIGDILRVHSNVGKAADTSHPQTILLDVTVSSLTWAILALIPSCPSLPPPRPAVFAIQAKAGEAGMANSIVLQYPTLGRYGVLNATSMSTGTSTTLVRIEGTRGVIQVQGNCVSCPFSFTVYVRPLTGADGGFQMRDHVREFENESLRGGFHFAADNAAQDVLSGKHESSVMPWAETIRVLELTDQVFRQVEVVRSGAR